MTDQTQHARLAAPDAFEPIQYADLHILDKESRLQPLTFNRAQARLIAALTGRDLVLKARQMGISTAIQAWLFVNAMNQTARAGTLAHDKETTQKLRDMTQLFYDELPDDRRPARGANSATRSYFPDTHSWLFYGTAGNARAGRGGTYSHVHGSEVAYWRNAERILAGLLQGVPVGGHIVLESTANGAQGWFYEQVMRALEGKSIWALHFFPWWWDDHYRLPVVEPLVMDDEERRLAAAHKLDAGQIAWRRHKRLELGPLFAQEYPEDAYSAFLSSGDGYFRLSEATFSANPAPLYLAGHRYVAGLDFGQTNDYTVCSVIDATTREQVALLRINRRSWAEMRRAVLDLCRAWGVHTLVAETNAMGSTNIESLIEEFDAAECDTTIAPFTTSYASKTTLIESLRLALEETGLTLLPDPAQRHELEIYTRSQTSSGGWQLSAPPGEHDDCVIALALAWHAAGAGPLVLFGG
ncbi:MAG: hypothetical protein IT320_03415 [Anaerolineae bacterium]|nr:hypothetical protein [Anaerolineae bacterium]